MMIVRNNIPVVGLKTVYEVHFQDEMIFAYLKRNLAVHDSVDVLFISTKTLNTYYGGQIDNVHIANGLEIKRLGENHYSIISYDDDTIATNMKKLVTSLKLEKKSVNNGFVYVDSFGVGFHFYKDGRYLMCDSLAPDKTFFEITVQL